MLAQEIIRRKSRAQRLDAAEIQSFVRGLVDRSWSEGQIAAFAMAVCLRGMGREECVALTQAMTDSGDRLDWSRAKLHGPLLDKHGKWWRGQHTDSGNVGYFKEESVREAVDEENRARSTREGKIVADVKLIGDRPSGTTPTSAPLVQAASAQFRRYTWPGCPGEFSAKPPSAA